jgi:hypothetical protein
MGHFCGTPEARHWRTGGKIAGWRRPGDHGTMMTRARRASVRAQAIREAGRSGTMGEIVAFEGTRRRELPRPGGKAQKGEAGFFDRHELHQILQLYSRKVMAGEWRDYAIGGDDAGAVFAVYGNSSPEPLYRIAKRVKPVRRQARYQVSAGNQVLQTESTLTAVLRQLEVCRLRLVDRM